MKIKVKVCDILEVLNKIKHIARAEKYKPVLSSGLFETLDDKIKITVSSLINRAVVTIPAIIEEPGKCLIGINQLVNILATMSGEVCIEDKETVVWIKQNKTKCRLNIINVSEFPDDMYIINNPSTEFSISSSALFDGLKKAVKFTDIDLHRIISGVFLYVNNSVVKFAATDGSKLAQIVKIIKANDISTEFVLPKESVNFLLPLISDCEDVYIKVNRNYCSFEFNDINFSTRLLQGCFPKYDAIIPTSSAISFTVNKEALKRAIERISVVETKEDNCRVYFSAKNLTLTVESKDFKCNDILDITNKSGEDIAFILNRVFLETVLSVISGDTAKFNLNTAKSAILFKDMENLYIVMPVVEGSNNV